MNLTADLERLTNDLLARLSVEGTVVVREGDATYLVTIETPDSALLIGRAGETLDALQTVIRLLARQLDLGEARLTVDVNGYRRQKEEELIQFVHEVGQRVKETGRAETLRPMSSYERRLVHQLIGEIGGLVSESTGEGIDRRLTVRPE